MNRAGSGSLSVWALFLAGPIVWFAHFMAVYLLVEAGCGTFLADRSVVGVGWLSFATLAATAAAMAVGAYTSWRAYVAWRSGDGGGDWFEVTDDNPGLAFGGFLLGVLSIVAVGFVGLPAAFLQAC